MPAAAKLIPIVKIPDPVLRQIAKPVDEITNGVRQLLDDMAATMYDAPGIGLAAPQINVSQRLVLGKWRHSALSCAGTGRGCHIGRRRNTFPAARVASRFLRLG